MQVKLLACIDVLYNEGNGKISFDEAKEFYRKLGLSIGEMHRIRTGKFLN